jgi:hypothetical protein
MPLSASPRWLRFLGERIKPMTTHTDEEPETLIVYNVHDLGDGPILFATKYIRITDSGWHCDGLRVDQLWPKPRDCKLDPEVVIAEYRAHLISRAEEAEVEAAELLAHAHACRQQAAAKIKGAP